MPATAAQPAKWNAADYAANSAAQQTWARELIAQLSLRGDEHILDVGCGDGKVTAEIARAVPTGSVTGIDASPEMIRFARKTFPPRQISNLKFQVMDARKIRFARAVRPCLFQRRAALGGRSSGLSARRGGGLETGRTAGRFLRRQGQRAGCFCRAAPGDAAEALARIFPADAEAVFFLHARRITKNGCRDLVSKSHSVKLAPKDATYRGRGRLCRVAAHDVAAVHPARAGKFARRIHCRRHGPLSRQTSAGCGGQRSRPHGAAGN